MSKFHKKRNWSIFIPASTISLYDPEKANLVHIQNFLKNMGVILVNKDERNKEFTIK